MEVLQTKGELRSTPTEHGVLSVMTTGMIPMLQLFAEVLDLVLEQPMEALSLNKVQVISSLMMSHVLEVKPISSIVLMMESVFITVETVRMLVSSVYQVF